MWVRTSVMPFTFETSKLYRLLLCKRNSAISIWTTTCHSVTMFHLLYLLNDSLLLFDHSCSEVSVSPLLSEPNNHYIASIKLLHQLSKPPTTLVTGALRLPSASWTKALKGIAWAMARHAGAMATAYANRWCTASVTRSMVVGVSVCFRISPNGKMGRDLTRLELRFWWPLETASTSQYISKVYFRSSCDGQISLAAHRRAKTVLRTRSTTLHLSGCPAGGTGELKHRNIATRATTPRVNSKKCDHERRLSDSPDPLCKVKALHANSCWRNISSSQNCSPQHPSREATPLLPSIA